MFQVGYLFWFFRGVWVGEAGGDDETKWSYEDCYHWTTTDLTRLYIVDRDEGTFQTRLQSAHNDFGFSHSHAIGILASWVSGLCLPAMHTALQSHRRDAC